MGVKPLTRIKRVVPHEVGLSLILTTPTGKISQAAKMAGALMYNGGGCVWKTCLPRHCH